MLSALVGRDLARRLRAEPDVDRAVAEAMIAVPRHRFVRWRLLHKAYEDRSLPTGAETSISQPTYVAKVISLARIQPDDRVLEIGTGSGWTAAVLGRLAREVISVERLPALAESARRRLASSPNVHVVTGDGARVVDGTFDAILVMAGAPRVPPAYCERLHDGGRLIVPVGEYLPTAIRGQVMRVTRHKSELVSEAMMPGDWNSLVGRDGWTE